MYCTARHWERSYEPKVAKAKAPYDFAYEHTETEGKESRLTDTTVRVTFRLLTAK